MIKKIRDLMRPWFVALAILLGAWGVYVLPWWVVPAIVVTFIVVAFVFILLTSAAFASVHRS